MPVSDDVNLSNGARVFYPELVNLYGCSIGAETTIGPFVEIQSDVTIGSLCKISSHTFICSGVTIEDEVFIGHGVMFTNDKYPRSTSDGRPATENDWELLTTRIGRGAAIGSGATVLCGITIGAGSMVGAGAVVTSDVAPGSVVAGNPARQVKSSG